MTASPVLLDDAAMRRLIIDGYLVLQPDFPAGLHERIRGRRGHWRKA